MAWQDFNALADVAQSPMRQAAVQQIAQPRVGGFKRFIAGALPLIGGALGAVGGSLIAPIAGTAGGGAAGSALGAALKQRLLGEKTDLGEIGKEAAFGAVPGVFKGAAAGVRAIRGARAAKAATEAERAAQQLTEAARKTPVGIPVNFVDTTSRGTGVKQVVNKSFRGPNAAADLSDSTKFLADQGYKTSQRGRSVRTAETMGKPGTDSIYEVRGTKTTVPFTESSTTKGVINPGYSTSRPIVPEPELAPASASAPQTRSLLSRLSTDRTRAASVIKTDPGVGGIERADEAAETFQRLGITGTPEKQLRKINEVMASHGKQVDDILAKNPIKLDGTAVKAQVAKAIEDPLKYADLDLSTAGAQRALNAHLEKFAQATTAKEVNDYVKVLNKIATKAKAKLDKGGTLTDKEAAALAAKRSGDEVLSQYPEIAPLKRDMATLFERNGDVTKASEKTVGIPILGIKSRKLEQARLGAISKSGEALKAADRALSSPAAQATKKVGGSLFNQFATRAVASPLVEGQSPTTTDTTNQTTSTSANIPNTVQIIPPSLNPTQDASASIDYEQEARNALAAGDYKAFDAIMSLAALAEKKATSGANKPLSAEAAKTVANANAGLEALNYFNQVIENDPSALSKTALPGRGVASGLGNRLLGTDTLEAAKQNVIDAWARIKTGAAISKDEEDRFNNNLPTAFDSQEARAIKMQIIQNLFTAVANRTGTAGTDIAAASGV